MPASVIIIDYGSGNLRSAAKAFEAVAEGREVRVTSDPADLASASHIVLPGVGAFADCVRGLSAVPGMREALEEQVRQKKKPFLGICVGMQMLFEEGHEHGVHPGLGWLSGKVVRLSPQASPRQPSDREARSEGQGESPVGSIPTYKFKVPQMGWNELTTTGSHPLLSGLGEKPHAYFVHSYHAQCANPAHVLATTDYGQTVTAVVGQGNIMGTQFHPEKSQKTGLKLLQNFMAL